MSHHRHREHPKVKHAVLMRVLSALLGLSFGFAAGLFFSHPLVEAVNAMHGDGTGSEGGSAPMPSLGAPLAERIAAAGRMDEDALSGLLTAVQEEWVRTAGPPEAEARTMLDLRILFSRWTDLRGLGALKGALGLKNIRLGDMALEAMMTEWGLRDMLTASQNMPSIPSMKSRERAMSALVRAGVQRSPTQGLAIAAKMTTGGPVLLRRIAGAAWMPRDATHALRFLTEEPGMEGALPAGWALGQWLLEDPAGFLAWRKRDPAAASSMPLMRFPEDVFSPGRLTLLKGQLQKEFGTLEAGTAWLSEAGGAAARGIVRVLMPPLAAAEVEMKAWHASLSAKPAADPASIPALDWLAKVSHARAIRMLAHRLADADPAAALKWLASLPAEEEAALVAPGIARRWLAQAPAGAPALIFAGDLSNPVMKAASLAAANNFVQSDPLKSLEGVASLPLDAAAAGNLRDAAFIQLASRDPSAMLEWITAHPGTAVPAGTTSAAVKAFARTDLARALKWVRENAPAGERASLLAGIFGTWMRSDRDAALEFLRSMPAGKERDAATTVLLDGDIGISENDAFFAANLLPDCFEYTLQLSGDGERLAALRRVLQCMKDKKVPVESSLNHRNLRPADRAALLKQP